LKGKPNPHFHSLFLDGVYGETGRLGVRLISPNLRMRTRMYGGVAGARRGFIRCPYADSGRDFLAGDRPESSRTFGTYVSGPQRLKAWRVSRRAERRPPPARKRCRISRSPATPPVHRPGSAPVWRLPGLRCRPGSWGIFRPWRWRPSS
jgi:hypothetical protein